MAKINYTDKVDSFTRDVPEINKVTAANMNEIKASVNVNVDNIDLAKTAAATTLDDTNLVVAKQTNLQAYTESADDALLRARSTGVSDSYTSSVSVGGTTFDQGAIYGEIYSDQGYFTINYAGATGITVTNLNAISTFVFIDNTGTLGQQTTQPTREDFTRKIFVMRIGVNTVTNQIIGFEYENNPIGHYANSIRDIYTFLLAQGIPFKRDQIITGRSTDLGFDVSSGTLLEFGGTGDIFNPNIKSFDAVANTTYNLLDRTTIVSSETNLVKFWDNNTSITALGSGTLVGHRLYRFSNGNLAIQYGQANYANMELAKAGAPSEEYVLNPALKDATFFGWWFINETATNTGGTTLTDFIDYTIGISGGSSSSLSGAVLRGNNGSDFLDNAQTLINLGVIALDNANVKLTGNQSIADVKTFTGLVKMTNRLDLSDALNNTFIGEESGLNNTTGDDNVAMGYESLFNNTIGGSSVAMGFQSLFNNTTGGSNVAMGFQSLYSSATAFRNVALGFQSLYSNAAGDNNVALGHLTLFNNTTGDDNVTSGFQGLYLNTTGGNNVASGYQSLRSNTSGNGNISLGTTSLSKNTSGDFNLGLGYGSGEYIADGITSNETGSNSIFIGKDTKASADGETNQIVIGDSAIGNGANTITLGNLNVTDTYLRGNVHGSGSATFDANINLSNAFSLMGRNAANTLSLSLISRGSDDRVKIDLDGFGVDIAGITNFASSLTANGIVRVLGGNSISLNRPDNGAGSSILTNASNQLVLTSPLSSTLKIGSSAVFSSTVTATNFIVSSDKRLKENVKNVDNKHISVDWKTFELKSEKGQKRYGVIAQELEIKNPEFVRTDEKGVKSVAYIDLLIAKIAELEARLKKIEMLEVNK